MKTEAIGFPSTAFIHLAPSAPPENFSPIAVHEAVVPPSKANPPVVDQAPPQPAGLLGHGPSESVLSLWDH